MSAFLLGFFSLLSQVFVLKELSGLLAAHEAALGLGLSAWMLWTAAGMMLPPFLTSGHRTRLADKNQQGGGADRRGGTFFFYTCIFFTAASGANLILMRNAGFLLKPGLLPGLLQLITLSFLLPLPAALANGLSLASGLSEKRLGFYRAETLGAAAGGVLTLAYALYFPGADPLLILGAAAVALILSAPVAVRSAAKPAAAILIASLFLCGARLAPPFAFPGAFKGAAVYVRASGSRLALLEADGQKTFIEDGAMLAQFPLAEQAGIFANLPLLAHRAPRDILFTGPNGIFLAAEAEKHHPDSVTISDPDRFRAGFLMKSAGLTPGFAKIEITDARALLRSGVKYDLIFQTTPEPLNAAANRFFTKEFFQEAGAALKKGGILAFTLPFSENYLPAERAYLAASVVASASSAFKHVEQIPGGNLLVLASDSKIDLTPAVLAGRYERRKLRTPYTTPANLPFLLDPNRRKWALASLGKVKSPPLNEDLNPAAYFYLWKMWLTMVVSPGELTGLALLAMALLMAAGRLLKPGGPLRGRGSAGVFLAGAWAMGFEIVALFMFQNHSGQLSWKLGMLFAAFMAGSSAGAGALKIFSRGLARALSLVLASALTCGLYVYAPRLQGFGLTGLFLIFMALLFACGAALGAYFAAAAGTDGEVVKLYYSDLIGAALGGFVFSAALIPLAGLRGALLGAAGILILIPLASVFARFIGVYSLKASMVKV